MTTTKNRIILYIIAGLAAVLIIGSVIVTTNGGKADSPAKMLSLGEKYLLELDYENAIVQFLKVIEVEPMNERAYAAAAEAYIGLGQNDKAIAILEQGLAALPDSGALKRMLEELRLPEAERVSEESSENSAQEEEWQLTAQQEVLLEQMLQAYLAGDMIAVLDMQISDECLEMLQNAPFAEHYLPRKVHRINYGGSNGRLFYLEYDSERTAYDGSIIYDTRGSFGTREDNTVHYTTNTTVWPSQAPDDRWYSYLQTTYQNGKANGPYERHQLQFWQIGWHIQRGTAVDGLIEGEVTHEFAGTLAQKSIYINGIVQPSGAPNENGELPTTIDVVMGQPSSYYPPDDSRFTNPQSVG